MVGGALPRQMGCVRKAANKVRSVPLSSHLQLPALSSCLTSREDGQEAGTVRGNKPIPPHAAFGEARTA